MSTTTEAATTKTKPTLPLEPLWQLAQRMTDSAGGDAEAGAVTTGLTSTVFADMIGFSARNVTRWRSKGGKIPYESADKAAVALGMHPMLVWGDDWLHIKDDFAAIAAGAFDSEIEKGLVAVGHKMAEPDYEAELQAKYDANLDAIIDSGNDDFIAAEQDAFVDGEMLSYEEAGLI